MTDPLTPPGVVDAYCGGGLPRPVLRDLYEAKSYSSVGVVGQPGGEFFVPTARGRMHSETIRFLVSNRVTQKTFTIVGPYRSG